MQQQLTLQARPGMWQLFIARKADPAFRAFAEKVFARDNYTCQFCGFHGKEHLEIVNLNHDYRHNKISNLVSSCYFCTQCLFIESVGIGEYGGGTLIYLPEISQTALNSLCHALFYAIVKGTEDKVNAQSIYRTLKFRAQIVERKFGDGTSNPSVFGQLLLDSGIDTAAQMSDSLLRDIRLLPARARFKKQIASWVNSTA